MEIISNICKKIKRVGKNGQGEQIAIVFIIVITGLSGFALGRLSLFEKNKSPINITNENREAQTASAFSTSEIEKVISGGIVASKNSSVYHFPWCSGASRMKSKNKVWFKSIEKAKEKGYRPAKNCKGLH